MTDYGRYGSAADHRRYAEPTSSRRKCKCGNRATHVGMANGVALTSGCEWCIRVWVDNGVLP